MKKLLTTLFLLLASPCWAAITAVGDLGSVTSAASNNATGVITTTATAEVNNQIVLFIAKDNSATTDTDNSEVTGVVDSASNNYAKLCEFTNGNAGVQIGATVSLWLARVTSQLSSGGTITASFSVAADVDVFAMRAFEFTATNALELVDTCQQDAGDNLDPASQTISGLSSAETLFLRAIAEEEGNAGDLTATANYTSIVSVTDDRPGTGSGAMRLHGEYRIFPAATGDSSNPSDANDADYASVYVALRESAAPSTSRKAVVIVE